LAVSAVATVHDHTFQAPWHRSERRQPGQPLGRAAP
jgi:hypothetical protein